MLTILFAPAPIVVTQNLFALTVTGEQYFGCILIYDSNK